MPETSVFTHPARIYLFSAKTAKYLRSFGGPPGDRTRDTLIKSQVLYH